MYSIDVILQLGKGILPSDVDKSADIRRGFMSWLDEKDGSEIEKKARTFITENHAKWYFMLACMMAYPFLKRWLDRLMYSKPVLDDEDDDKL